MRRDFLYFTAHHITLTHFTFSKLITLLVGGKDNMSLKRMIRHWMPVVIRNDNLFVGNPIFKYKDNFGIEISGVSLFSVLFYQKRLYGLIAKPVVRYRLADAIHAANEEQQQEKENKNNGSESDGVGDGDYDVVDQFVNEVLLDGQEEKKSDADDDVYGGARPPAPVTDFFGVLCGQLTLELSQQHSSFYLMFDSRATQLFYSRKENYPLCFKLLTSFEGAGEDGEDGADHRALRGHRDSNPLSFFSSPAYPWKLQSSDRIAIPSTASLMEWPKLVRYAKENNIQVDDEIAIFYKLKVTFQDRKLRTKYQTISRVRIFKAPALSLMGIPCFYDLRNVISGSGGGGGGGATRWQTDADLRVHLRKYKSDIIHYAMYSDLFWDAESVTYSVPPASDIGIGNRTSTSTSTSSSKHSMVALLFCRLHMLEIAQHPEMKRRGWLMNTLFEARVKLENQRLFAFLDYQKHWKGKYVLPVPMKCVLYVCISAPQQQRKQQKQPKQQKQWMQWREFAMNKMHRKYNFADLVTDEEKRAVVEAMNVQKNKTKHRHHNKHKKKNHLRRKIKQKHKKLKRRRDQHEREQNIQPEREWSLVCDNIGVCSRENMNITELVTRKTQSQHLHSIYFEPAGSGGNVNSSSSSSSTMRMREDELEAQLAHHPSTLDCIDWQSIMLFRLQRQEQQLLQRRAAVAVVTEEKDGDEDADDDDDSDPLASSKLCLYYKFRVIFQQTADTDSGSATDVAATANALHDIWITGTGGSDTDTDYAVERISTSIDFVVNDNEILNVSDDLMLFDHVILGRNAVLHFKKKVSMKSWSDIRMNTGAKMIAIGGYGKTIKLKAKQISIFDKCLVSASGFRDVICLDCHLLEFIMNGKRSGLSSSSSSSSSSANQIIFRCQTKSSSSSSNTNTATATANNNNELGGGGSGSGNTIAASKTSMFSRISNFAMESASAMISGGVSGVVGGGGDSGSGSNNTGDQQRGKGGKGTSMTRSRRRSSAAAPSSVMDAKLIIYTQMIKYNGVQLKVRQKRLVEFIQSMADTRPAFY